MRFELNMRSFLNYLCGWLLNYLVFNVQNPTINTILDPRNQLNYYNKDHIYFN